MGVRKVEMQEMSAMGGGGSYEQEESCAGKILVVLGADICCGGSGVEVGGLAALILSA